MNCRLLYSFLVFQTLKAFYIPSCYPIHTHSYCDGTAFGSRDMHRHFGGQGLKWKKKGTSYIFWINECTKDIKINCLNNIFIHMQDNLQFYTAKQQNTKLPEYINVSIN